MRWICVLQSFTDSWLHVIMFRVLNYVRGVEIGVWCFYSCVMKKNNVVNKDKVALIGKCINWWGREKKTQNWNIKAKIMNCRRLNVVLL